MSDATHTPASLRVRLGLTQAQVAERASEFARKRDPKESVSISTIGRLEDGRDVSLDSLRDIAPALETTIEALIAAIDVVRTRHVESRSKPRGRKSKAGAA